MNFHNLLFSFPIDMFVFTSKNPIIFCFHNRNCSCLCYFYHISVTFLIQRWLIGLFLKVSYLISLLECHNTLSEILLTACSDQLLYNLRLTLSWRRPISYRLDWFLYDIGLRHERVNRIMLGMFKTKRSSKCQRCLFIISKINIL